MPDNRTDVCVIILTRNEEANIGQALDSVVDWASEIFILDSYSDDRTLEIAGQYPCTILQCPFENYSKQRNCALESFPIKSEWVLFLDADEWAPQDLKEEITSLIDSNPAQNGFYIKYRFIFMGKWIKRGYYPTWILRLFRFGKGRCEERGVNEHLILEGPIGYLDHDFIHEDRKSVSDWITKHNRYAELEARELFKASPNSGEIDARILGTQAQRKRWLRHRVWNHLPPLVRPFIFFAYRYLFCGGFLDGRAAFIFHFLQALWFPLLIDVKFIEMRLYGNGRLQAPGREGHASPKTPPASA